MWRSVRNYLAQALGDDPRGWHPLLAVYYLTYACDFRCPYCSDGAQQPYYRLRSPVLPAEQALELLRRVRRHSDYLVLTGGEPLKHPGLDAVLEGLPAVGFDGVVLTTNGHDLEPHLARVARAIRYLVFSLDTLDHARADACFGRGPGTLARILANIDRADALRPRAGFEIVLSALATPDNLEDLYGVYDYARRRGFRFALCPQLQGVKAHPALHHNPAYRALYDHLIREKRRGGPVNGSVLYLEHMRDLRKFDCKPSTVLALSPTGDVFYPCLERGTVAGNLLEQNDLHAIRAAGRERHGPEPRCDNRCHSACALGFAMILSHPLSLAHEAMLGARNRLLGG